MKTNRPRRFAPPAAAAVAAACALAAPRAEASPTYFGYYAAADYTDEVADHVNATWLNVGDVYNPAEIERVRGHLALAAAHDLRVVLDLSSSGIFFAWDGALLRWNPAYQAPWDQLLAVVAPYRDRVVAVSPFDEPHWHATRTGSMTEYEMTLHLDLISTVVHAAGTKLAVIYAYPNMYQGMLISWGIDWVGFDCYGSWEHCGDGRSVPDAIAQLKSGMVPGQKILAIPQSATPTSLGASPSPAQVDGLLDRLGKEYLWMVGDPLVEAAFPFLYWTYEEGETTWWGQRNVLPIDEAMRANGSSFTGRYPLPPPHECPPFPQICSP